MKSYYVNVREVHYSVHLVEANSPEEAKEAVKTFQQGPSDVEVIHVDVEYSHTCDHVSWTVEETS